jgi:hypothetical protein
MNGSGQSVVDVLDGGPDADGFTRDAADSVSANCETAL